VPIAAPVDVRVRLVEEMPLRAPLQTVNRPVRFLRERLEMGRVDASWVPARVMQVQPVGDRPDEKLVREAVSGDDAPSLFAVDAERAVTLLVELRG